MKGDLVVLLFSCFVPLNYLFLMLEELIYMFLSRFLCTFVMMFQGKGEREW